MLVTSNILGTTIAHLGIDLWMPKYGPRAGLVCFYVGLAFMLVLGGSGFGSLRQQRYALARGALYIRWRRIYHPLDPFGCTAGSIRPPTR